MPDVTPAPDSRHGGWPPLVPGQDGRTLSFFSSTMSGWACYHVPP
ncbi:hypothetical protein LEMLEM_LOCUS13978 [Lemmus lemmus]